MLERLSLEMVEPKNCRVRHFYDRGLGQFGAAFDIAARNHSLRRREAYI